MKRKRGQLELAIHRPVEPDRNFEKGGRSFYFFDFDDNVAFLSTPVFIFHKHEDKSVTLSSREFAEIHGSLGQSGAYQNYELRYCEVTGSFRHFRDRSLPWIKKVLGGQQNFVKDLKLALKRPAHEWQGPSWSCFFHAVHNRRPISLITARGHDPETLKTGFRLMVQKGFLPHEPNYLTLFPVNHPEIRRSLGGELDVAELKRAAIRASVEKAVEVYGNNPHHRFGMSDDDPKNLDLITTEMARLKKDYPGMSFFAISTFKGRFVKHEVFEDHIENRVVPEEEQLKLF